MPTKSRITAPPLPETTPATSRKSFAPKSARNSTSQPEKKFGAVGLSGIHPDRVEFDLGEVVAHSAESVITVAISIFKFDRMEWAIEKCTELGVARIVPVIAGRT